MAVKRTTAATQPPAPVTVPSKAKSAGKIPAKAPVKPPAKAGPKPASKPAVAQTVKITRPLAAHQAVVTRNARAPAAKPVAKAATSPPKRSLPFAERLSLVAETAYYLSENRGFMPGYDLADWLEAEQRVDARFHFT